MVGTAEIQNKIHIHTNLFSDTATMPTPGMRQFIANAEVGDEQKGTDPTINALTKKVCSLLGKEDAIFLPSGTMCNLIASLVHCSPGDEIICDKTAHTLHYEAGGSGAIAGATTYPLDGINGVFTLEQFETAIRPASRYFSRSRVVLIEQTSNLGNGSIWPLKSIEEICARAAELGIARHMDGARLMNAVVATGISASTYAAHFDSVWIDFTKNLGAPVGAVLAGSKEFIKEAWNHKQRLGGAMRQAGIIGAAALYALDNNIERLKEDHDNAKFLATGLAEIKGISVEPVETNMVFFDVSGLGITPQEFCQKLETKGVQVGAIWPSWVRAVTHLSVSRAQIEEALEMMQEVVNDYR